MAKILLMFLALTLPTFLSASPISESFRTIAVQASTDLQNAVKGTSNAVIWIRNYHNVSQIIKSFSITQIEYLFTPFLNSNGTTLFSQPFVISFKILPCLTLSCFLGGCRYVILHITSNKGEIVPSNDVLSP